MQADEIAVQIAIELIRKSGVREALDVLTAERISITSAYMAEQIIEALGLGEEDMATLFTLKGFTGTPLVVRSSGGDFAIALASVANSNNTSTGARQSQTIDLGAEWDQSFMIETEFELAATPTAGNAINIHGSFNTATGAGKANTSGSDAAYTGYSNNISDALRQIELLGVHVCTSQATATVQKCDAGTFRARGRYLNLVVHNQSGAAFHSSDTNCLIRLIPVGVRGVS